MPPGFDVTKLDTGMDLDDLGEVLAGTPAEMDDAILGAVGLPYEQFTSCVVLPQGQFADFLHAKPATRQQILVNLLGLHVYEEVQQRAVARERTAEAKLGVIDQQLAGLAAATDEAVEAADRRLTRMRELTAAVEESVPGLRAARAAETEAARERDALDAELRALAAVRTPEGIAEIAGATAAARASAAEAAEEVRVAEEREEKVRGELAAAGDAGSLKLMLDRHAELDRLLAQAEWFAGEVQVAEVEFKDAQAAAELAHGAHLGATQLLEQARLDYTEAQRIDRAAALRAHLAAGEHCPVCEQTVTSVPAMPEGSAVRAAEATGKAARAAAEVAESGWKQRDAVARKLEGNLERKRAQHEHHLVRLTEVRGVVAGSPGVPALESRIAEIDSLQRKLDQAGTAVRTAREAQRRAQAATDQAQERERAAWRTFDQVRDLVARFAPPPAERDDLAAAWSTLVEWASGEHRGRVRERDDAGARVSAAHEAAVHAYAAIAALFTAAGITPPARREGSGEADLIRAAAVAATTAEGDRNKIAEMRDRARELSEQRMTLQRDGRVAKALAGHLRANNFERWLLEEALDLLVDGASRILRELTSGQYDLVHDKGEFYVIDHHDAGLRRGVRTLSGGETFQASLALALALSEQLAGMSTTAASLESIVLDEGFGTLDAATLDVVAATLENLAARGDRMVGLVTHVTALAERVPVRFEVTKDARSARVERVGL
jgi:exonuclease SbcC